MRVAIVAGEASGDTLGAALIAALRAREPQIEFAGVGGPKMRAAGCEIWESSEALAVMGIVEVVKHLPRLLRLRRRLRDQFIAAQPDVFVGIDAPEFNLGLARKLKRAGLTCVQYVSPQVWAWRQGRVHTIGESTDLVLCLLPFEPPFYAGHGVRAAFVGHPLADQIPLEIDRAAARKQLGLPAEGRIVALLPGSRRGEVERLGADFVQAARALLQRDGALRFLAPMASAEVSAVFAAQVAASAAPLPIQLLVGEARAALAACDVAIVASGTATLETALSKRPMVVAYRLGGATAFLLRRLGMVKVRHIAQPNLLAGREVVPEFLQEQVTGEALAQAAWHWFESPQRVASVQTTFAEIHRSLRVDGAARAAESILQLVAAVRQSKVAVP